MKVLFAVRNDSNSKSGGDLIQAGQYKTELERKIPDIEIHFAHQSTKASLKRINWDIVHFFNIERLQDFGFLFRYERVRHFMLSPILHPGFRHTYLSVLKTFVRSVLNGASLPDPNFSFLMALHKFSYMTFLSDDERNYFQETLGGQLTFDSDIVINGTDHSLARGKQKEGLVKKGNFLIVGRIEERKNVIQTIRFIKRHYPDCILTIVGDKNQYQSKYFKEFKKEIENVANIKYLGKVSFDKVLSIMEDTEILLTLSRAEVSPLVDLEALASGCKVLSTIHSWTHLAETKNFQRVNPDNEQDIIDKIDFLRSSQFQQGLDQVVSWEEALRPLVEKYKTIASND